MKLADEATHCHLPLTLSYGREYPLHLHEQEVAWTSLHASLDLHNIQKIIHRGVLLHAFKYWFIHYDIFLRLNYHPLVFLLLCRMGWAFLQCAVYVLISGKVKLQTTQTRGSAFDTTFLVFLDSTSTVFPAIGDVWTGWAAAEVLFRRSLNQISTCDPGKLVLIASFIFINTSGYGVLQNASSSVVFCKGVRLGRSSCGAFSAAALVLLCCWLDVNCRGAPLLPALCSIPTTLPSFVGTTHAFCVPDSARYFWYSKQEMWKIRK